jgi:hypothetical protein
MMKRDNRVEQKKNFDRDWVSYILGFEDNYDYLDYFDNIYSSVDRDLEALQYGCDMSSPYLSQGDKIKVKRYRRDSNKR